MRGRRKIDLKLEYLYHGQDFKALVSFHCDDAVNCGVDTKTSLFLGRMIGVNGHYTKLPQNHNIR